MRVTCPAWRIRYNERRRLRRAALRPPKPSFEARFWARTRPAGDCLLWTGAVLGGTGYGSARGRDGRTVGAHRLAYELTHGPIPQGLHVLHSCDVPACVNPDHLRVGTRADNMADMDRRGRRNPPTERPSLRGERHGQARLTEELVLRIRARRAAGESATRLADENGVSVSAIYSVTSGRTWSWL